MPIAANIPVAVLDRMDPASKGLRLRALLREIYGDGWQQQAARDMRRAARVAPLWASGRREVPVPVLVALAAMLGVGKVEV